MHSPPCYLASSSSATSTTHLSSKPKNTSTQRGQALPPVTHACDHRPGGAHGCGPTHHACLRFPAAGSKPSYSTSKPRQEKGLTLGRSAPNKTPEALPLSSCHTTPPQLRPCKPSTRPERTTSCSRKQLSSASSNSQPPSCHTKETGSLLSPTPDLPSTKDTKPTTYAAHPRGKMWNKHRGREWAGRQGGSECDACASASHPAQLGNLDQPAFWGWQQTGPPPHNNAAANHTTQLKSHDLTS